MPSFSLMPHSQTIFLAMAVAILMSPAAPLVTSPNVISSATRPPIFTTKLATSFFAAFHVGQIDGDLSIKASGAEQCRIEHVGAVRRRDDDDAFLRVEPVHLHE